MTTETKKNIDPFDVKKIDDLPDELKSAVAATKIGRESIVVQVLQTAERPLTIVELMVGIYRITGTIFKKSRVYSAIYHASTMEEPTVKKEGSGTNSRYLYIGN